MNFNLLVTIGLEVPYFPDFTIPSQVCESSPFLEVKMDLVGHLDADLSSVARILRPLSAAVDRWMNFRQIQKGTMDASPPAPSSSTTLLALFSWENVMSEMVADLYRSQTKIIKLHLFKVSGAVPAPINQLIIRLLKALRSINYCGEFPQLCADILTTLDDAQVRMSGDDIIHLTPIFVLVLMFRPFMRPRTSHATFTNNTRPALRRQWRSLR